MPTITRTIEVTTDGNGAFSRTEVFNPPGPFRITISDLKVRLLSPADTTLTGMIDVDAADSSPQNPAQNFTVSTGEQISLGAKRLDGGDNILVASGQTSPVRADSVLQLEIQATI